MGAKFLLRRKYYFFDLKFMAKTKVLFTLNEEIATKLVDIFKLEQEKLRSGIKIFSWKYEEDDLILCLSGESRDEVIASLTYIHDNYDFIKFINLWTTTCTNNFDYSTWDILIPNTFVSRENENPIFVSSMPEGNYDLDEFWVIFNWICFSSFDEKTGNILDWKCADMSDIEGYSVLSFFSEDPDFDEKFLVIKLCGESNYYLNLVQILRMVL